MRNILICMLLFTLSATCVAMPIEVFYASSMLAHPAVLINSAMENNLPNELRNEFYRNPKIATDLAKESWFINKEMQVTDRETDKISREKIYDMLHHAGLVRS